MASTFNTANKTFRELFASGISYCVPRFQRDYSWTSDEWDDLWRDVEDLLSEGGEPAHYMGYLVLQTRDNRNFDIIDGQQRLTTLSLLVLAVLNTLNALIEAKHEPEANQKRLEQFRATYIGDLDPVTLVARPRLTLNRNNDDLYKDYLVALRPRATSGLRASEKALKKSFDWFAGKVRERLFAAGSGAECARFLEDLSDKLFFTVITVNDELNAFKVFETLNARGVRLSPTDLLKNYLFSIVHKEGKHEAEIDALERRWQAVIQRLGADSFPDFLRAHWNSRRKLVRHAELFKTIRAATPDRAAVFSLLQRLEADVDTYAALNDPENPLWEGEQRSLIADLRMFAIRQHWPFLLAARRAFDNEGFTQVLKACVAVAFRYNVIGNLQTNEQETVFNQAAQALSGIKPEEKLTTPLEAIRALSRIYVSDDNFRSAFAEKMLQTTAPRNKKIVRYILFKLERHVSLQDYDADSALYTLEHVLPINPAENTWTQFDERQAEDMTYRLGNMTMLKAGPNRALGNASFDEKKAALAESEFTVTRRIAEENENWTPERLAKHQRWMADQAVSIWRVPQLAKT
jgi:hypothetical protein